MEAFAWRVKQRSPDIDPEVRPILLLRAQNASPAAATKKVCSAGCGLAKERAEFSGKQWAGRAVRRCLDCVQMRMEPKLCAHGKGAFDCAACIAIVKQEDEYEAAAAAAAAVPVEEREPACVLEAEVHVEPEQHDANKKYTEALSVAAEACAEAAKGQTCYICTQAVHWRTKEGLVRGCSCRGTAGFAHLSCLTEQAKILMDEAEENNLGDKVKLERFRRWYKCSLCEQSYHGVVAHALGLACRKTYLGQPEGSWARRMAMAMTHGLGDDPTDTDGPRLEGVRAADENSICANCGRDNASKTCGRCMAQAYCSTECQRADWKRHKASCQSVEGLEASAAATKADASEWMTASDASEKLSEKLSMDAVTGKEIGTAVASYARTLYREENATKLGNKLADTLISRNPSEEAMLAEIRQAGLDRPEKPGRLNVIKRFREASVAMSRAHNARLAAEKFEEIKKLEKSIAAANSGDDMLAQLVQKRPLVLAELLPAVRREERMERRIARRKCDVCQRADPVSSPRFLLCAGCGKRRYCSEDCQKLDWLECGHKAVCALVSEFECRVTPDCAVTERDYCDWCAETFCMDCEVDKIAPCANCGRFSCGSLKEHTTGPRGPCPVVIRCDTCGDGYCGECREEHEIFEVYTCDVCKTSSCGACGETTFCDMCQNNYCWNCRAVESCADCDKAFCADCDPVRKCINCDKTICTKCSFGNEENGIPHVCRDCEVLAAAYHTLTARGASVGAGPWSSGERQALSLVVGGLPQPCLREVWPIIGLGLPFPDGDNILNFASLPVSVCDRAHQCVVAVAKVDDDDDAAHEALAERVEALEAKP